MRMRKVIKGGFHTKRREVLSELWIESFMYIGLRQRSVQACLLWLDVLEGFGEILWFRGTFSNKGSY